MYIAQVMGVVHLHVRTCRCAPFPYLGNDWTDCAEFSYVVGNLLARRFTEVDDGVQLHVRTLFPCLGNSWTDCAEIWCVVMGPASMRFIGIMSGAHSTCARAHHFSISQ